MLLRPRLQAHVGGPVRVQGGAAEFEAHGPPTGARAKWQRPALLASRRGPSPVESVHCLLRGARVPAEAEHRSIGQARPLGIISPPLLIPPAPVAPAALLPRPARFVRGEREEIRPSPVGADGAALRGAREAENTSRHRPRRGEAEVVAGRETDEILVKRADPGVRESSDL